MIIVIIILILFFTSPLVLGIYNWIKYKNIAIPAQLGKLNLIVNSAVLYAMAYNLIFFLQELFLVIGKKAIGLKAILYHNNHIWEGEHPMTLLMQGSGAMAIFVIGLICILIYSRLKESIGVWRLFFLWMAFHGLLQSIPQVMVTYFDPNTDVGEALVGYFHLGKPYLVVLAVVSIIACALLSIWFSKQLLQFATTDIDLTNPKAKLRFIQNIAVAAAFIGSIAIIPFRILPISQAITPFIVFIFSIPWTWAAAPINKTIERTSNRLNDKVYWNPIAILILLLIFFRLALAPGMVF